MTDALRNARRKELAAAMWNRRWRNATFCSTFEQAGKEQREQYLAMATAALALFDEWGVASPDAEAAVLTVADVLDETDAPDEEAIPF